MKAWVFALIFYLLGSFFGIQQVIGMFRGAAAPAQRAGA